MMAILTGVRGHLLVPLLLCISLIITDVEHLLICLLVIWMSFFFFLKKCLFGSSAFYFFFRLGGCLFVVEFNELFVYFGN